MALALLVVSVRGCGCGGSRASVATAKPPRRQPPRANRRGCGWTIARNQRTGARNQRRSSLRPQRQPRPESRRRSSLESPSRTTATRRKGRRKPVRPKDFAKWKPDDYLVAQRESDPRLLEAVSYLGQGFADKEKAAEILLKLLEGLPPSAGSDDGPAAGRGAGGSQPVEAIVAALAANGTPSARRTIEQLAAGELKTSDNRAAAAAAVAALLSRPSRENEDALFRVVTLAGRPQPAGRKPAAPDAVRTALLEAVKSSASAAFRLRLAKHMIAAGDAAGVVRRVVALPAGRPRREPGGTSRPLSERPAGSGRHRTVGTAVPRTEQRRRGPALGRSAVQRAEAGVRADRRRGGPRRGGRAALERRISRRCIQRRLLAADTLGDGARLVLLAGDDPHAAGPRGPLADLENPLRRGPQGVGGGRHRRAA